MTTETNRTELHVSGANRGTRLDLWLVFKSPELSRARVHEFIESGLVLVDGSLAKPSFKLRGGEQIVVEVIARPPLRAEAEAIPLDVVYDACGLLVVNKPAGMSVHAGAGNSRGTLV